MIKAFISLTFGGTDQSDVGTSLGAPAAGHAVSRLDKVVKDRLICGGF